VTKGSKIYLTVEQSDPNVNLFLIPEVTGMTLEQATETITNAGLVPIVIDNSPEPEVPVEGSEEGEGAETDPETPTTVKTVVNQLPKSEIKVQEKTEILIYVE